MLKPNSTVTTNLIKARELIADEKNWCRQTMFGPRGSMCAMGALVKAGVDNVEEILVLQNAAKELSGQWIISEVNDMFGHAAVMRMFDRAIELSLQD